MLLIADFDDVLILSREISDAAYTIKTVMNYLNGPIFIFLLF